MYKLRTDTPPEWAQCVLADFDTFLLDHAAEERKAHAAALHFAVRYHDKPELIDAMLEVAKDELEHFHDVFRLIRERGKTLAADEKDPYVNALLSHARSSGQPRLLDRLLIGSITEFRGCERFAILSRELDASDADPSLADFYSDLAAADSRHRTVYYEMACNYFPQDKVDHRLDTLLDHEADIVSQLPLRPALH